MRISTHAARSFSTHGSSSSKTLRRPWGWKMVTVHEKMLFLSFIKCVSWQVLLSGSVVEKLRAAWVRHAPPRSFDSAPQALCHPINRWGAPLRMTILWEFNEKHLNKLARMGPAQRVPGTVSPEFPDLRNQKPGASGMELANPRCRWPFPREAATDCVVQRWLWWSRKSATTGFVGRAKAGAGVPALPDCRASPPHATDSSRNVATNRRADRLLLIRGSRAPDARVEAAARSSYADVDGRPSSTRQAPTGRSATGDGTTRDRATHQSHSARRPLVQCDLVGRVRHGRSPLRPRSPRSCRPQLRLADLGRHRPAMRSPVPLSPRQIPEARALTGPKSAAMDSKQRWRMPITRPGARLQ